MDTIPTDTATRKPATQDAYLLCFDGGSSVRIPLPLHGSVILGDGDQADIRIPGPDVAPAHALLVLEDSDAVLEGIGPAESWAILVNGDQTTAPRRLISGDTISLGGLELVFHGPLRRRTATSILNFDAFRWRLVEETERCSRTSGSLALVVLEMGESGASTAEEIATLLQKELRQIDVVGRLGETEWAIILLDTDDQASIPSHRLLGAICSLVANARAGFARCPADASEADPLLTGARQAARCAPPGRVLSLPAAAARIPAGEWTLIAADPAMRGLVDLVSRLALTELPVLIIGDTGVGKEVIAQTLHNWSNRRAGPLVTINCAAIAPSLFESELFGHERGAFTGATETKPGLLEVGGGGTVLLDEIGECPPEVQAKLLRVLDTHRVCRVGSVTEHAVDIRILAATNRDLEDAVDRGTFRRDLYYRLNTAVVTVPPLSHRPLDIPLLAQLLAEEACARIDRPALVISSDAMRRLTLHDWPGNVRELRNLMEFCVATCEGSVLEGHDLPARIAGGTAPWLARHSGTQTPPSMSSKSPPKTFEDREFQNIRDELQHLERTRMLQALEASGGIQNKAASLIGMPLRTFVSRMREYEIPSRRKHRDKRSKS